MRGSADTTGMPDVKSRPAVFCFEIVSQDRLLEMKLESTSDLFHSEMRAARGPFFGMTFRQILSLLFLSDSSSEGERCMKHIDHSVVHFLVHLMIFRRVRNRRSYAGHDDQFGRGQNTGLGWSDPTFTHVSVPKVIRGVAPAQVRVDRAECFVRAAFHSRGPQ